MKICMQKQKIGGKHTNRTDISVSVCILSTDGQAALRKVCNWLATISKWRGEGTL